MEQNRQKKILYHGTILKHAMDIFENGINLDIGKEYLDFGKGFYTTTDISMAIDMARRVSAMEKRITGVINPFPTLVKFEYVENNCLNSRVFEYEDMQWARFILANRVTEEIANKLDLRDSNSTKKYDIVIGGTADGSIARISNSLRYDMISLEEYEINLSDFLRSDGTSYGTQVTFHTKEVLTCIKCIGYDIITERER